GLLIVPDGEQRSAFASLKDYPPAATISSMQAYVHRYHLVRTTGIEACDLPGVTPAFLAYLCQLAKRYSATDLKRFADPKRCALTDLRTFQRLEERGYGDLLLTRYPSLRKYFAAFLQLPFAAVPGNTGLLDAIAIIRQLDAGTLKRLPPAVPTGFVLPELHRAL